MKTVDSEKDHTSNLIIRLKISVLVLNCDDETNGKARFKFKKKRMGFFSL